MFENFEWGADGDSVADSGGTVTWTVIAGGTSKGEIDTAQHYAGTRCMRLYRDGTNTPFALFSKTPLVADEHIFAHFRKDDTSQLFLLHGNGTYAIDVYLNVDEHILYWDTAGRDTGATVAINTWYLLEIRNVNWTAHTYDIYLNGSVIKTGAVMFTTASWANTIQFANNAGTSESWIDDIEIITFSTPTYSQLVITTYSPSSILNIISTPTALNTLTLRPNGAGDETSISTQSPSEDEHWDKVDEVVADDAGTYVITGALYYQRDLYALPNHSTESGIISSIKIYIRCGHGYNNGRAKPSLKCNSVVTDGDEVIVHEEWTTTSQQWNLNPSNSLAWTWEDIDSLQIGVALKNAGYSPDCTQVYVEVTFITAGYPSIVFTTYTPNSVLVKISTPTYAQIVITTYTPSSEISVISTPTYAQLVITTYTPSYTQTNYDYLYRLQTGFHKFFSKAYRNSLVLPNRIQVTSLADDDPQYYGEAIETVSNGIYDCRQYEECHLASDAQGKDIAEAMVAKYKMAADYGFLEVPMNVGQEMFDYIGVIDTREGDTRTGNAGYIRRIYNNLGDTPEYQMSLGFGNWFPAGEPITETSPGGLGNSGEQSFERLYALDGYIENLTADNILLYTMDDIDDGTTYKKVLATEISGGYIVLTSSTVKDGEWYNETGVIIDAEHGIGLYGGQISLRTYDTYEHAEAWGSTGLQIYIGTDGKLYAGGGSVLLDSTGIAINGISSLQFRYNSLYLATIGVNSSGNLQITPFSGYIATVSSSLVVQGTLYATSDIEAQGVVYGIYGVVVPTYTAGGIDEDGSLLAAETSFWWYRSGAWHYALDNS